MDNSVIYYIITGLLLVGFAFVTFKSGRSKKLKITTAKTNLDGSLVELIVTRKASDSWNDGKGMKLYRKDDGKKLWLSDHWVLEIEEI